VTSLAGIAAGSFLASRKLSLPCLTGGLVHLGLAVFLLFFTPEHRWRREPAHRASAWGAMRSTFAQGVAAVVGRPALVLIIIATARP
jgi:hypothetical protein